jgi:hypothetical protein
MNSAQRLSGRFVKVVNAKPPYRESARSTYTTFPTSTRCCLKDAFTIQTVRRSARADTLSSLCTLSTGRNINEMQPFRVDDSTAPRLSRS